MAGPDDGTREYQERQNAKDISHDTRGDLFTFPTILLVALGAYLLLRKKGKR